MSGSLSHAARAPKARAGAGRIVVADPEMVQVYDLIGRLASVRIPVLIVAETGCGKELVARQLHEQSPWCDEPLVALNCAAIHEQLAERELFGHARGAYTGAGAAGAGLFEAANGGTLFLDELGELSMQTQAKLLRVLETGRFARIGEVEEREVKVRIVAATNRDLEIEVEGGRFRRDLFFRLSAAVLHLPPLRRRPLEIGLLADEFLSSVCRDLGRAPKSLSRGALELLQAHHWPGNVRELKNLMEYLGSVLDGDEITGDHVLDELSRSFLPVHACEFPVRSTTTPPAEETPRRFPRLADELRDLVTRRMTEALIETHGNKERAARLLDMPVRTFYSKVKGLGIDRSRRRSESND